MTLKEKIKVVAVAINEQKRVVWHGAEYIVSGYSIVRSYNDLLLSVRLTDCKAASSWLWLDERKYFKEVEDAT